MTTKPPQSLLPQEERQSPPPLPPPTNPPPTNGITRTPASPRPVVEVVKKPTLAETIRRLTLDMAKNEETMKNLNLELKAARAEREVLEAEIFLGELEAQGLQDAIAVGEAIEGEGGSGSNDSGEEGEEGGGGTGRGTTGKKNKNSPFFIKNVSGSDVNFVPESGRFSGIGTDFLGPSPVPTSSSRLCLLPKSQCLRGRESHSGIKADLFPNSNNAINGSNIHRTKKTSLLPPFPSNHETIVFGMGCFWCAESCFYHSSLEGIFTTHVGYMGGVTKNPTYQEVSSGKTNHAEVVRIIYDPKVIKFRELLRIFWISHDSTTPFQQGNDRGSQYRSVIYCQTGKQLTEAEETKYLFEKAIQESFRKSEGVNSVRARKKVVTEIKMMEEVGGDFYYAERDHQQYDAREDVRGYCGLSPLPVEMGLLTGI